MLVVGGGWLGRPAVARLCAQSFPHGGISVGAPSTAAVGRLRDAIRPDEGTIVVNLSGLKWGARGELLTSNALIPETLAEALAPSGAHLVQVGSAAEYGIPSGGIPLSESAQCLPVTDYGITKLRGTEAVLAAMPTATVLRPFNIVDTDLPVRSPLIDIRERIGRVRRTGATVDLIAASTSRDYVSRRFVIESIASAVQVRPAGVYNICSGVGVGTGQVVRMILDDLGLTNEISSSDEALASSIVGNPTRWRILSGQVEELGCRGVVDMLQWSDLWRG